LDTIQVARTWPPNARAGGENRDAPPPSATREGASAQETTSMHTRLLRRLPLPPPTSNRPFPFPESGGERSACAHILADPSPRRQEASSGTPDGKVIRPASGQGGQLRHRESRNGSEALDRGAWCGGLNHRAFLVPQGPEDLKHLAARWKHPSDEREQMPGVAKSHKADSASTRDAASKGLKDLLRRF
jgi:hypothetical protein